MNKLIFLVIAFVAVTQSTLITAHDPKAKITLAQLLKTAPKLPPVESFHAKHKSQLEQTAKLPKKEATYKPLQKARKKAVESDPQCMGEAQFQFTTCTTKNGEDGFCSTNPNTGKRTCIKSQ